MKKLMTILLAAVLLASCDKFLDLKPENIKVVSTVEDYRDLLASYMRFLKTPNRSQMKVLGDYFCYPDFDVASDFAYRTGELTPNKKSSYYDATLGEYTTAGVERLTWYETPNMWDSYYTFLGPINMIIGGIETAEGDDERLRDYVKGEALVWRAYSYLKLLQYHSPYKTGNEYGVPIYLKPYEDPGNAMPARETQTTVYQQILSDCEEVLKLLERTPSTNWNCAYEPVFVHSLLAHVYWYKAMSVAAEETDWQNALEHAEFAMKGRTFVYDPTVFVSLFDASAGKEFTNDEFNLRFIDGSNNQMINVMGTYYQGSMSPSAETASAAWQNRGRNSGRACPVPLRRIRQAPQHPAARSDDPECAEEARRNAPSDGRDRRADSDREGECDGSSSRKTTRPHRPPASPGNPEFSFPSPCTPADPPGTPGRTSPSETDPPRAEDTN